MDGYKNFSTKTEILRKESIWHQTMAERKTFHEVKLHKVKESTHTHTKGIPSKKNFSLANL